MMAVLLLAAATLLPAAGLDKRAQDWLDEVRLLILPEEETVFRTEFQWIFWARRLPDPRRAKPEPPEPFRKARARADELFGISGKKGSRTGCGEIYLLLGEADEISGREVRGRFDSLRDLREGSRRPEVWIYKTRLDRFFSLPGGELRIEFDDACRFAEAARIMEELRRLARAQVRHPELDYARGAGGHLRRLEDALAAGGPVRGTLPGPAGPCTCWSPPRPARPRARPSPPSSARSPRPARRTARSWSPTVSPWILAATN